MLGDGKSVLMLDGDSIFSQSVAICLAQVPNLKLHVLSRNSWSNMRVSRHAVTHTSCAIPDILETVAAVSTKQKIDVIMAVDEPANQFLATHREVLSKYAALHPFPKESSFSAGHDKACMAEVLVREKIPCPKTVVCSGNLEKDLASFSTTEAILLKPRIGGNGRGIKVFETPAQAESSLHHLSSPLSNHILQSYIPGYDIDCSVLCKNGRVLAHTIQKGIFPGSSRFMPYAGIEFVQEPALLALVERLVCALDWNGVAHGDFRYDERDQTFKVIELNPRYWGSILGSLKAGVNFPYLGCLTALGIDFERPSFENSVYFSAGSTLRSWKVRHAKSGTIPTNMPWKFYLADPFPLVMQYGIKLYRRMHNRRIAT